ncbi:hypothetical protein U1Q18_019797 [Sarracenia purpurea var. burkii]
MVCCSASGGVSGCFVVVQFWWGVTFYGGGIKNSGDQSVYSASLMWWAVTVVCFGYWGCGWVGCLLVEVAQEVGWVFFGFKCWWFVLGGRGGGCLAALLGQLVAKCPRLHVFQLLSWSTSA